MKTPITLAAICSIVSLKISAKELPKWITDPPSDSHYVYSVGESKGLGNKEDALERAWISALLRIGMTQFPEVGQLKSESEETLSSANYNRKFVLQLERVRFTGIKETTSEGSPFVVLDEDTRTYSVFRLIRWSKKDISLARASLKSKPKPGNIPLSPEARSKIEDEMISDIQQINSVNSRVEDRNTQVARVLKRAKCGVTIDDIRNILGEPDRTDKNCRYYWGTYEVFACNPNEVDRISPNNGNVLGWTICSRL